MQNALDHVTLLNPSKEAEGRLDLREGGGGRWRNAFKTMTVSCAPDLVPRNAKQGHETSHDAPISKQHFPLRWARETVRMLLDQGVKPVVSFQRNPAYLTNRDTHTMIHTPNRINYILKYGSINKQYI